MLILDKLFEEVGLVSALIAGELCGALFALWLMRRCFGEGMGRPDRQVLL